MMHDSDGSVFYRYPDRSEYYRHRNGNIRFKPPQPEGEDRAASKSSTPGQGWYDWPPRLDLTVKTDGSSYIIKDATGPPITFEPVVSGVGVNPTPARNGSVPTPSPSMTRVDLISHSPPCRRSPSTRVQFERNLSQLNHGTTSGVQGRMNGHALADVLSDNEDY